MGTPITVGSGPSAIAITARATMAYVTNEGFTNTAPGSVTPITISTNTPGTPIPVGSGPDAIAITPNGLTAYVGNYNDNTVTPINLLTNAAGTPIPAGGAPTSIAITPDGSTAYVGRADDAGIQLDLITNSIQSGASPSGFASAMDL